MRAVKAALEYGRVYQTVLDCQARSIADCRGFRRPKLRKKALLISAVVAGLALTAFNSTKLVFTWLNPNSSATHFKNIMVVGINGTALGSRRVRRPALRRNRPTRNPMHSQLFADSAP